MKQTAVKLSINVLPSTKTETLDGIEYLVAPAVLMPVGVHNGSDGPIFYPGEELEKWAPSWNHKPLVVNHPTLNGEPASAANKTVMESSQIGFLLNASYSDSKQKAEAWVNKAKCQIVCPDILTNLSNQKTTEISTGLFVDNDEIEGTWNSEKYVGTARNHRPDHLAVLPDSIGAASVGKGAGLLANAAKDSPTIPLRMRERFSVTIDENGKPVANALTINKLSFQQITSMISDALRARFGLPGKSWYGCVLAVYEKTVIYEGDGYPYVTYALGYTMKDDQVSLDSGEPKTVQVFVEYRTADGSYVANRLGKLVPNSSEKAMDRKDIFSKIVGEGKTFSDADKGLLEKLGPEYDDLLGKLAVEPVVNNTEKDKKKEPVITANDVKPEEKKKTLTPDELFSMLDPQSQEVLLEMKQIHNSEKDRLIKVITNAKGSQFKADDLKDMKLDMLKKIAAPLEVEQPAFKVTNFFGSAPAPVNNSTPSTVKKLGTPTINDWEFSSSRKKPAKETAAA